jgi:hypothetical protein
MFQTIPVNFSRATYIFAIVSNIKIQYHIIFNNHYFLLIPHKNCKSPFLLFYISVAYQMGDACDVGEQCVDPNSSCIDGACQCKVNYIASLDGINCIPSKSKSNMNKKPVGLQWQKTYFST